ncbi:beta-transducin, putative [Trichomonas vaginalis G3]|uniref:Beta-transducin, putative n=1 Tax=Trichomonas vaginalis (strain ATCC PRA-98 / G3) TaxID=412133 RepID=A2DJ79_TRIV3|nr:Rab GTPase binding [Trichomonas vaginalis G3]EAY19466.1 beta-transducin, putative [Trichomonas vaginalis G3]KAI5520055.1 Rab GTPase binding [Trichomonas vaginalis G3]|eukprot:XP_001580452.1 beta-transducin [Trichomonas vaginalis G3]
MNKNDTDPVLQIKDLDNGTVMSIEELERSNNEFTNRMRSKSTSKKNLIPEELQFTTFNNQEKDPFFKRTAIADYLPAHKGNVWCVAGSSDGKYSASGGEDGQVIIYTNDGGLTQLRAFKGHTSDVVMLEFSNDNFLLSCSLDSTVRLWHPTAEKELAIFQHEDAVTAVSFLPTDSSIILAATLGNTVFVWSVRENEVIHRITFVSPPTAAGFSPDGNYVAIGCLNGFVFVYTMPEFRYVTQFIAGPRGKKQTSNEKVTSIQFLGNEQFLIATNDSRIRLYALENFSVVRKFLGHESKEAQLRLSVSSDNQLLMTPSENTSEVFIWPVDHSKYFKGSGLFGSFLKDRSKTYEGFKYGKKYLINAAAFIQKSSIQHLAVIVGDNRGGVSKVISIQ